MAKVINDNYIFFEKGVNKQVEARTPKRALAELQYSCTMCPRDKCAEENCAIKIAHKVAMANRLNKKASTFFNNGIEVQKKAFNLRYATKQFAFSCDICKACGYCVYMRECSNCPIKEQYEKNLRTLR